MSAEQIATVVADLRAGRVLNALPDDVALHQQALKMAQRGTVVDATAIYDGMVETERQISFYEDHPCIAPPWESALLCYLNGHGNVVVMSTTATELHYPGPQWSERESADHLVDWERVRWRLDISVWLGGLSDTEPHAGPVPTAGPAHLWRIAVYEDGYPADINWVNLLDKDPHEWDMALTVLLESLNFVSCRNVVVVEPQRPRAERRRLDRIGVGVHTINVVPVGRSYRGTKGIGAGVPLTSVRGHFAHYGEAYGKGLLFGRLSGRFFVPQHARGARDHGESAAQYRLVP